MIVGPTASGKSALAIRLAKKFKGEIVSADSRQVYRGLDIGSGKVTKREMRGVPHHMLDVTSLRNQFTVVNYSRMAHKAIDDILSRSKLPIIVGGTGLYIKAIVDGVAYPEVPPNPKLRKRLEKLETGKLFQLLVNLDSGRSRVIDKNNPRRLIRAIEIAKALGAVPPIVRDRVRYVVVQIGLKPAIHDLRFKIHERVRARLKRGWIREVNKLHEQGLSWKRIEDIGLGYKIIAQHLQGRIRKPDIIPLITTAELNYTKRQMTWFKRDKRIIWIEKAGEVSLSRLRKLRP